MKVDLILRNDCFLFAFFWSTFKSLLYNSIILNRFIDIFNHLHKGAEQFYHQHRPPPKETKTPYPLASTDLFSVALRLPFPECNINRIILYMTFFTIRLY